MTTPVVAPLKDNLALGVDLPDTIDPQLHIYLERMHAAIQAVSLSGDYNRVFAIASIDLVEGLLVSLYSSAGTITAKLADASIPLYAQGFVSKGALAGNTVEVTAIGDNKFLSGLAPGNPYYLSTAGGITTTPPANPQIVGFAVSDTVLYFYPQASSTGGTSGGGSGSGPIIFSEVTSDPAGPSLGQAWILKTVITSAGTIFGFVGSIPLLAPTDVDTFQFSVNTSQGTKRTTLS